MTAVKVAALSDDNRSFTALEGLWTVSQEYITFVTRQTQESLIKEEKKNTFPIY
jgi:hypothetical protein